MSKINISELKPSKSELKVLNETETTGVLGGRRRIRNSFNQNIAQIVQVNNFVNIQIAFGNGSNSSVGILTNNAGVNQNIDAS